MLELSSQHQFPSFAPTGIGLYTSQMLRSVQNKLIRQYLWPHIRQTGWFLTGTTLLALFAVLIWFVQFGHNIAFDNFFYPRWQTWATDILPTWLWHGVTLLGNLEIVLILCIVIIWRFIRKNRLFEIYYLIASVGGGSLGAYALKSIVNSARPSNMQSWLDGHYAFPSGHATITFCLYVALFIMNQKHIARMKQWKQILIYTGTIAVTILLPISRLALGVHWTTDVIGGTLLGLGWILVLFSTFDRSLSR